MDHLIEPGIRSYFNGSFEECKSFKMKFYSRVINTTLLAVFILVLGTTLYYKKKTRLTVDEKRKQSNTDRAYIINKVRSLQIKNGQIGISSGKSGMSTTSFP